MAIYEKEETFVHYITLRDRTGTLTDADSCLITITSPCDVVLVNGLPMTHISTGIYSYTYDLLSTAIYGQYNVSVRASDGGVYSVFPEKFFVMPWNIQDEIRTLSGQGLKKISDDDLSLLAWNSFREVIQATMEYHHHEKLECCVDDVCACCGNIVCDCAWGCGSPICSDQGKSYTLKNTPIADWQIDSAIHGCECQDTNDECHNDICGMWIDNDGVCHDAAVKVINSTCGEIEAYQDDCVTKIPANNQGIYINYHSTWRTYNLTLFKKAVIYLAYYELALREFLESKKASSCDERARYLIVNKIQNRYRDILDSIRRPMLGGVK